MLKRVVIMQTIHDDDLRSVIGGAGFMDMLGPLLQNAGPIMNGISGIISAAKGGGAQPQAAADPSQAAAAQQAAAQPAPPGAEAAAAAAAPGFVPHRHRPRVSVSVSSF
ncbi:MAG: hypothetical protein ABJE66_12795 [Deltaproteobacteria bacterium]